jgi:hypothetical protein
MNGKVASTKVRTINGAGYVSIADMAKALAWSSSRRAMATN